MSIFPGFSKERLSDSQREAVSRRLDTISEKFGLYPKPIIKPEGELIRSRKGNGGDVFGKTK